MKKTFFVLLLIVSLVILPRMVYSEESKKKPTYTFSFYSEFLTKNLFPKIEKRIKDRPPVSPTEVEAQTIANEVFKIIGKSLEEEKFTTLRIPTVTVYRTESKTKMIYCLEIMLTFYDEESTVQNEFLSNMVIGKRFIIFIRDKNTTEV